MKTVEDAARLLAGKVHVYVATPCYSCQMTARYATSLLVLQQACIRFGIQLTVDLMGNESLVPRARNLLTARFLKSSATHLLFIDADIGFEPQTVMRLCLADKDIACAVYPKKDIDWALVKSKLAAGDAEDVRSAGLDYNINIVPGESVHVVDGFIPVLDAATGFMCLQRRAVERMVEHFRPTLLCVNDIPGSREVVAEYVAIFDCMIDTNRRYLSEDYAACRRAQEIGLEIWADVASVLSHTGTNLSEGEIMQRFQMTYCA